MRIITSLKTGLCQSHFYAVRLLSSVIKLFSGTFWLKLSESTVGTKALLGSVCFKHTDHKYSGKGYVAVVGCIWNLQFERKLQEMKKSSFSSSLILQTHQHWYVSSLNTKLVREALPEGESCPQPPSSEQLREGEEGDLYSASRRVSHPGCTKLAFWKFSRYLQAN